MPRYYRSNKRSAAVKAGFASGFEQTIHRQLLEEGVTKEEIGYEERSFSLALPSGRGYSCGECGSKNILKASKYTPDFFIGEEGNREFIIETKGRFTALDRKKALAITSQHDVDYRMLFEYDNLLSKGAKSRYSTWCEKNDIPYAVKEVPKEWINQLRSK